MNAESVPYGFVRGEAIFNLPRDLYIPPDALEVVLDIFEGPLDLLLYLIKKHNIDILNIPVAAITRQYMDYVQVISALRLELAADYLEMAATLAEIKSRLLLPKPPSTDNESQELDPRAELVRRLQNYERFKIAATQLERLPRLERDTVLVNASVSPMSALRLHPPVELETLVAALKEVLSRVDLKSVHHIQREVLSVREKMSLILAELAAEFVDFVHFFDVKEGRLGIVVTFLAILELVRESLIELVQNESFGAIYIRVSHGKN